ncbi:MAG TPA: hypothetical protein VHA05_01280 [Candidatus Saccharimonadales bacterium]|jgi:hypothetical protein|nr:hypothetical protein [Candidatus Saccharimonadales bacterium]
MSFVSHNSAMRNRMFFVPVMIVLIATLAFASNALAAKSVRMNVLAHYGVKGLTTGQAGSQSMLYGGKDKGLSPSNKVAKIVRSGDGVELKSHKGEKVVFAGYYYEVPSNHEVVQERWNGKGVLPLTKSVNIDGKQTQVKIADVFVWILKAHHESTTATLPTHSE